MGTVQNTWTSTHCIFPNTLFGLEYENSLYFKVKGGLVSAVILVVYIWITK